MDEYMYDRLNEASVPFTGAILRALANKNKDEDALHALNLDAAAAHKRVEEHFFDAANEVPLKNHVYGQHFVEPVLHKIDNLMATFMADSSKFLARLKLQLEEDGELDEEDKEPKANTKVVQ